MIILHGEDIKKSYQRLCSITEDYKNKNVEVIIHDAVDLDITGLSQELNSSGLFGTTKLIVIKNLMSGKKSKEVNQIIKALQETQNDNIVLYEDKKVSVSIINKFSGAKVEHFAISPIIFKFLDSLRPNNLKQILVSWNSIKDENTEPEFVFAMIVRQVKLMVQSKSTENYLKIAPYPARLIRQQATFFQHNQLLDLYHELHLIDQKIKTGKGGNNLENLLINFFQKI